MIVLIFANANVVFAKNTAVFVMVGTAAVDVEAAVAVIASIGNNTVVLADILHDVALAFAIGRTAFVSA